MSNSQTQLWNKTGKICDIAHAFFGLTKKSRKTKIDDGVIVTKIAIYTLKR
jgi:hypothetical protein